MVGRGRAGVGEFARRVNAAAELLESGMAVAQAARVLADRFGCSVRQARRYVDGAARGATISALVAQALTEFLARGRSRPRRR
jgi:hypothetical protein